MTKLMSSIDRELLARFPEMVKTDARDRYVGVVVEPDQLIDFSKMIRDELGYDYLSSVTGVDYLPDDLMEVVYHAYKSTGGGALVYKVQVPRENPVVPSLVSVFPSAELQEREAWDLLGIRFTDHPDLVIDYLQAGN